MISILIVDDNLERADLIRLSLCDHPLIFPNKIDVCCCAIDCKKKLKITAYNVLILDVVIPLRSGDKPSSSAGLSLLEEISRRKTLKKPERIIGITSHVEDYSHFLQKFSEKCIPVIETPRNSKVWVSAICSAVNYFFETKCSLLAEKDIVVIPVHGIRTFGKWHDILRRVLSENFDNIEVCSYRYGYFSALSFIVPFARRYHVKLFERNIEKILTSNQGKRIVLISHSFGTYLVAKAIERLIDKGSGLKVSLTIFSGSVLKSAYNISKIHSVSEVIVNDCGANDFILCLSQIFVPGTGMAGRTGFYTINNDKFINRYFSGGHSHYFDDGLNFMEKYWVPAIVGQEIPSGEASRTPSLFDSVFETFLEWTGYVKEPVAYLLLCYALYRAFFYFAP